MKEIPHYCQNCGCSNSLGERNCRKCGTRLMIVVFPPSIRHDDGLVPSFYEDHLLERVTLLEIRLSQVVERLAAALDLVLRQTKSSQSDHLLLETLIDSLNTLGAIEKDTLRKKWQKKINFDEEEITENKNDRLLRETTSLLSKEKKEIFSHLIKEGLRLLANNEVKQSIQTLDKALQLSPQNTPLLLFLAETEFQNDNFVSAKKYLEKIINFEAENSKAQFFFGLLLADSFDLSEAKAILKKLIAQNELKFCGLYILGFIYAFENDWTVSLYYFKEALMIYDLPETHYLIGCIFFQQKKFKSALKHLQKAVENDTNFADAWFMLAVIYKILGDETKSYQSIELAWSSKEAGAECLKFMKRGSQIEVEMALPFFKLKDLKKNLIMGNSIRFTRIIRGEVLKILND